jgi:hypothetical protein
MPDYENDGGNNVNYNPVVLFNGVDLMTLASTGLPAAKTARSIFAVAYPNATTGNQYMISWGKTGTGDGYALGATGTEGLLSGNNANVTTPTGFWAAGSPQLMLATWDGNDGAAALYGDYSIAGEAANENYNTGVNGGDIGYSSWGGGNWNGAIAEILVFPSVLSTAQELQVGSYLAIKYGFSINEEYALNYSATNGTVIWNATNNATYPYNITGLGRDDAESLYQKQSRNNATGFQLTVSAGSALATTNSANASTFTNNVSYLMWGDNGASTAYTRSITNAGINYKAMVKTWLFDKTNWSDENITIAQDSLGTSTYMLVSSNATFTSVTQVIALNGSGAATINSSLIPSGSFVTFAKLITLPVNLISFGGETTKGGDVLSWQTAGEINNAYFAIERSTDGITFDSIGRVNGQGNTVLTQDYTFTDSSPLYSYTNYYRLHQVDLDGYATNSYVVALRPDGGPLTYLAYPNPAGARLHLSIPTQQSRLTLNVYTTSGIRVQNQVLESPGTGADLDVSRLATGVYFLVIMQPDGEQKTLSFMKQ